MTPIALCMLGIAIVLSITPIQIFYQKTVYAFKKMKRKHNRVSDIIGEVTRCISEMEFKTISPAGVAKGLSSPRKRDALEKAAQYSSGGKISFILLLRNDDSRQLIVRHEKGKFTIWKGTLFWYFREENGDPFVLLGKNFSMASALSKVAEEKRNPKEEQRIRIQGRRSSSVRAEIACCS